jgi:hypothetical protein
VAFRENGVDFYDRRLFCGCTYYRPDEPSVGELR